MCFSDAKIENRVLQIRPFQDRRHCPRTMAPSVGSRSEHSHHSGYGDDASMMEDAMDRADRATNRLEVRQDAFVHFRATHVTPRPPAIPIGFEAWHRRYYDYPYYPPPLATHGLHTPPTPCFTP